MIWSLPILTILGCGINLPDPELISVQPDRGWNGEATVVNIHGQNFYPQVQLEMGTGGQADLDQTFAAWLVDPQGIVEDIALLTVGAEDYRNLVGVVESGIQPGHYDLRVEGPSGRSDVLKSAFVVADSRADGIAVVPEALSLTVNSSMAVELYLVDPNDQRVSEQGFGIDVWLVDDSGVLVTDAEFDAGGLIGAQSQVGGLSGRLGTQGSWIGVSVGTPGIYTVFAAPENQRDGIRDGNARIEWTTGNERSLGVMLPPAPVPFVAQVGTPFDVTLTWFDEFGNPVPEPETVLISSDCSGFLGEVLVSGPTTYTVNLESACPSDRLGNILSIGNSELFEVEPGPVDHFAVQVLPKPAVAGELLNVQVVAEDAFGNPTDWSGALVPSISNGGLLLNGCVAHPFNVGEYNCDTVPTVAGIGLTLDVAGDDGTTGSFSSFAVGPGNDVGEVELTVAGTPVSGQTFQAQVSVRDSYGNTRHAGQWLDSDYVFEDELDEVSCTFSVVLQTGMGIWDCALLTARTDAVLHVDLVSESVGDDSVPFVVINGPLADVLVVPESTVAVDPNVVEAGSPFDLRLSAVDAHGNAMVVLVDRTLDLTDDTETLTPATAVLDATGQVVVPGVLTTAGITHIDASQLGEVYGTSPAVQVLPAVGQAFAITVVSPWVWVGRSEPVLVEAMDAFGNRVDWTGSATVHSDFTGAADLVVSVTNGVGVGSFIWPAPRLDETLSASSSNSWVGSTVAFDVVEDCGVAGPVPSISFAGFPEAIACVAPVTGLAAVSVSFAGSVQGTAPIARYVIAMNGGERVSSATTALVYDLPGVGVHDLLGLVLDSAGCAVEVSAVGYAGDADGELVGPIDVVFGDVQIDAIIGSTTLDLTNGVDCARDVAVGATVFVRTGLGEVTGATSTGAGLSLVLDAVGSASVSLDAASVDSDGDAEVHVWVASGAGGAVQSLPIVGDSRRPVVWAQTPTGEHLDFVDEVVLTFSEPMRDLNLVPANFSVFGPSTPVVQSVLSEDDDTVVRIQLDATIDGALGIWTVQGLDSLRDRAGNRLGGDWNVGASDYLGAFGDVGTIVDEVFCDSLDPVDGLFRPDGDPGIDGEQDEVVVNVSVALAPAWWEVSVRTNTGTLIRRERVVPSGVVDSWAWDGRDQAGRVVDNGVWQIEVEPVDGLGNHGQGCVVNATVDNLLGVSP